MAKSQQYRVHFFEGLCTVGVTRMAFASDEEALARAATFPAINTIEVWNGNRKIYRRVSADMSGSSEQQATEPPNSPRLQLITKREHVNGKWRMALRDGATNDQLVKETRAAIAESRELLKRPFRLS